jgi:diguanylate cyclase (GGDEF)-like protein
MRGMTLMKKFSNDLMSYKGMESEVDFHSFLGLLSDNSGVEEIVAFRYNRKDNLIKNMDSWVLESSNNWSTKIDVYFMERLIEIYGISKQVIYLPDVEKGDTLETICYKDRITEINTFPLDESNIGVVIIFGTKKFRSMEISAILRVFVMCIEEKIKNGLLKEKLDLAKYTIESTSSSVNYGFIIVDSFGRIKKFNDKVEVLLNKKLENSYEEYIDQVINIVHENPHSDYLDCIDQVFISGVSTGWGNEGALISDEGDIKYIDICYSPCFDESGNVDRVSIMFSDITEKVHNEGKISYISKYDIMTGIYNREHFIEILENPVGKNEYFSIVVCDIDGLRTLNTSRGYSFGDFIIKSFGKNVRQSVGENDVFARWGEDEFAILVNNSDIENVNRLCKSIQSKFDNNLITDNQVTISFGVSVKENEFETGIDVLYKAEKDLRIRKNKI